MAPALPLFVRVSDTITILGSIKQRQCSPNPSIISTCLFPGGPIL